MILIADSGSTKTDWRLVDENKKIHQFSTAGFNPLFQSTEIISKELREVLLPQFATANVEASKPMQVFYYGASCSSEERNKTVRDAIAQSFPKAEIEVDHDLLGAARALCGHEAGIAVILGTGSNSCYYDGKEIVENVPSLGYILGDEGSGAHIGKTFITAYLYKEMPEDLSQRFSERFKITKEDVLEAVYKKPMPSRFLASFSKFIYQNLKEQYVVDLVAGCFRQFFDKQACKYEKHNEVQMHSVGSVGFYYSNILRAVAVEKGVNVGRIIETPIAGLTLYHAGE
jgi:N-acetylglucosamine kinase-like BadF-type ATPase